MQCTVEGLNMTAMIIETGIPCPPRGNSPVVAAMRSMDVGQSFLITEAFEYGRARGSWAMLKPKKFAIRKVPHEGWRVWRLE